MNLLLIPRQKMQYQLAVAIKLASDLDAILSNGFNPGSWMQFKLESYKIFLIHSRTYCIRVVIVIFSRSVMQGMTQHTLHVTTLPIINAF